MGRAAVQALVGGGSDSRLAEARAELARKIASHIQHAGEKATVVPGLTLYRRTQPTPCNPVISQPSLTVFAQGRKRVNLGGRVYGCDETTFLLASVSVPVTSQIIMASEQLPLLSLHLTIEMPMVRDVLSRGEFPEPTIPSEVRSLVVGKTTRELLSVCSRLLDLLDAPQDIPFLAASIQREIVYRLLRSPEGGCLRALAALGGPSHRTALAVAWLQAHYDKPLRMEELAAVVRMGVSTLHHHFRTLTGTSPLQYQKQLRLHAARERMLKDGLDAASAAFEVGYESASQFNREYRRFFGQPPRRDLNRLRAADPAAWST